MLFRSVIRPPIELCRRAADSAGAVATTLVINSHLQSSKGRRELASTFSARRTRCAVRSVQNCILGFRHSLVEVSRARSRRLPTKSSRVRPPSYRGERFYTADGLFRDRGRSTFLEACDLSKFDPDKGNVKSTSDPVSARLGSEDQRWHR